MRTTELLIISSLYKTVNKKLIQNILLREFNNHRRISVYGNCPIIRSLILENHYDNISFVHTLNNTKYNKTIIFKDHTYSVSDILNKILEQTNRCQIFNITK